MQGLQQTPLQLIFDNLFTDNLFSWCSLFTLKSAVIPTLLWILPDHCEKLGPQHLCNHKEALALYSFLRFILIQIFYVSAALNLSICYYLFFFFWAVIRHVI